MKRHKMVNLCETSYEAASRMNNFSGWVRTQVLKNAAGSEEMAISATKSRNLLAVVLARQQEKHGFDSKIVQHILTVINDRDLV